MTSYAEFLASKAQWNEASGFEPISLPDYLFDFQRYLCDWSIRQGRAALLIDCGMGKSALELAWAENVRRRTGKPVILATPLGVTFQMLTEAEKFGVDDVAISRNGKVAAGITVTNYEQLEKFDPSDFGGMVCDECFAPDTEIDTPVGPKHISDVRIGDRILNASGVDTARAVLDEVASEVAS